MTFYIIGVPIGMKMFSKIVLSISLTLPLIALVSYLLGTYFSKKFISIQERLHRVSQGNFTLESSDAYIEEIYTIEKTVDELSVQLRRSIEELEEKNSELTWMVRSFSHDFRTPLTIIQANIEAIEDGLITPASMPKTLQKIKLETTYMNELLVDVLSFIQSMKSNLQKEKIVLKEFISHEIFTLLSPSERVELINNIGEETLFFTKTDLKKILINLIDNSLKFTERGSISLFVEDNALIIQDTGVGIKHQESEIIFKPFYTVDVSKNRLKSGFGLGLSIAKNLAEKNGYTLRCDSEYLDGCRMVLS